MTSRLFIGNLAEDVTEEDLRALFGMLGTLLEVEVIRNREHDKSRGFGFVQFETDASGQAAIEKLHGTEFHGRRMRVKAAEPKKVGGFNVPNTSPGFFVPPGTSPDNQGHPPMTPPPATPMPVMDPHAAFTPPPATPVATPAPVMLVAPPPPRSRWWMWVVAVVLVASVGGVAAWRLRRPPPDLHTLMILPMDVYGQTQGAEYVGYAFAQAVAVNLATVHEVRVLPVPRSSELAGASSQARAQTALDSGAGRVVMGSLTRRKDGMHISLTLVDAIQNRILWGTQREAKNADDQTWPPAWRGNWRDSWVPRCRCCMTTSSTSPGVRRWPPPRNSPKRWARCAAVKCRRRWWPRGPWWTASPRSQRRWRCGPTR